ncbi:site-specific integrase [Nordella sp. HKS 07]|uniref:tyrosine-type recombinase/integrase n=1 Tax=Nordella sp. HKS 07 TaxID=2712222 RepID=UPI0013E10121|nr:site-specific integrase [Nordella sp. HKS 07]QIG46779.1 site-specific integrase [Nordella sp. HKS 07]
MAKRVYDKMLDSRAAREKLPVRGKPYYRSLGQGLHLGYRKNQSGGRWVARLYVGSGDYRVETIADADDRLNANGSTVLDFWQAQKKAHDLHKQLAGPAEKVSAVYTVEQAVDDYLIWMADARKSAQDARYKANASIIPVLGSKDVSKLKASELRHWLRNEAKTATRLRTRKGQPQKYAELTDDPESIRQRRATANRILTVLKAALNHAWREGKVTSDAEWRRVLPYAGVDGARVRYLTIAEAKRLVNAAEPAFRKMVQAALKTGCRYGELAALKVADFNPDVGTVTIRDSKSGKARHVILTEEGGEFFRAVTLGKAGDEIIFTHNGGPWRHAHQSRPMAAACKAGSISPSIGFHGLRHTWASLSVMAGVPLMVVAKNLGHSDTRMVEKHYGHLAPSFVADQIRAGAPRFGTVEETNVTPIGGAK